MMVRNAKVEAWSLQQSTEWSDIAQNEACNACAHDHFKAVDRMVQLLGGSISCCAKGIESIRNGDVQFDERLDRDVAIHPSGFTLAKKC